MHTSLLVDSLELLSNWSDMLDLLLTITWSEASCVQGPGLPSRQGWESREREMSGHSLGRGENYCTGRQD